VLVLELPPHLVPYLDHHESDEVEVDLRELLAERVKANATLSLDAARLGTQHDLDAIVLYVVPRLQMGGVVHGRGAAPRVPRRGRTGRRAGPEKEERQEARHEGKGGRAEGAVGIHDDRGSVIPVVKGDRRRRRIAPGAGRS